MSRELERRTALVTGSSRGIGAAIARRFAAEGAAVAVHGRDTDALQRVVSDINDAGGRAAGITGDVTEPEALERIRREVETQLGPVDLLVANAGANLTAPALLEDIPIDGWRATVDANLLATFLTLRCFFPGMKERGRGDIITISSAAGRRPHPRSPIAYSAAKAGIQLLTQDVALQAGPSGIRANCIAPETILTDRTRTVISAAVQEQLVTAHAIRRLGDEADVAETALFLASPARSGWITGVVIDVAGGSMIAQS